MKRLVPFVLVMALAPTAFAGIRYSYSPSSSSTTPGGSDTQVQYNNAGAFGGITGLTSDGTSVALKNGATSAGYIDFNEDSDNGSNRVRLIGPASTADITLTLPSSDGDADQVLKTDGAGNMSWATPAGGSAAGSNTHVQFNDGGTAFGGDAGLTYNKTTDVLTTVGGIATTSAGTANIGSVSNYFNGMWANAFWAYSGASWMKMTHSGSYCYFTTNDGPFYFSDSIILGASGEVLNFTLLGNINLGSDLGGKLNVDGSADESQLWIQGHSTQTNNIVLIEKSDGTDILSVANTGSMKLAPVASPPGTPTSGDIYVDSTADPDELCFYDGTGWQGISSGTDGNCA